MKNNNFNKQILKAIQKAVDYCNLHSEDCDVIYKSIYRYKALRELSEDQQDEIYDIISVSLGYGDADIITTNKIEDEEMETVDKYDNKDQCNDKNELLQTTLNKIETLDKQSTEYEELNKQAKELIKNMLHDQKEVTTNKGMKKVLKVNGKLATQCKKCHGTGKHYDYKNGLCGCIRGWFYDDKLKVISIEEYKKRNAKKYLKNLIKKNQLSKYTFEDLIKMNLKDFLYITE